MVLPGSHIFLLSSGKYMILEIKTFSVFYGWICVIHTHNYCNQGRTQHRGTIPQINETDIQVNSSHSYHYDFMKMEELVHIHI